MTPIRAFGWVFGRFGLLRGAHTPTRSESHVGRDVDGLEFGKWLLLLLNGATIAALLGAVAQELAAALFGKSGKSVLRLVGIGQGQSRASTSTELELGRIQERRLSFSSSGSSDEDESADRQARMASTGGSRLRNGNRETAIEVRGGKGKGSALRA